MEPPAVPVSRGENPPALRIVTVPGRGRSFVATRDLKAGELLLECLPYGGAVIVDEAAGGWVCWEGTCGRGAVDAQGRASALKVTCKECPHAHYCSKACRDRDWEKFHGKECAFLSQAVFSSIPSTELRLEPLLDAYARDYVRLLARVIAARVSDLERPTPSSHPLPTQREPPPPTWSDITKMCTNLASWNPEKLAQFSLAASYLRLFTETHLGANTERVFECAEVELPEEEAGADPYLLLVCREECNSFGLYTFGVSPPPPPVPSSPTPAPTSTTDPAHTTTTTTTRQPSPLRHPYGLALYPNAVFFNHSCAPNSVHVSSGGPKPSTEKGTGAVGNGVVSKGGDDRTPTLRFYAHPTVPPKGGEEVSISYTSIDPFSAADSPSSTSTSTVAVPGTSRRSLLRDWFLFPCGCARCAGELAGSVSTEVQELVRGAVCDASGERCGGRWVPGILVRDKDGEGVRGWKCEACGRRWTRA